MLEQTEPARPRGRRGRPPLGRQPPAGEHRDRAARRAGRAAARRAVGVAGSAPARPAVGLRDGDGARAARPSSTRPTTSARPSATPTACSSSPTASCCSPARRRELEQATGGEQRARALRGGVRRVPARARATDRVSRGMPPRHARTRGSGLMRWLLAQGPADPAALAAARRAARPLPDPDRGADRARASRAGPDKPQVAFVNLVPPGQNVIQLGGQRLDASKYAGELFKSIEPVRVKTPRGGHRRRCSSGDALGALIVPADITDASGHGQPLGRRAADRRGHLQRRGPGQAALRAGDDRVAAGRGQPGALRAPDPDRGELPEDRHPGRPVLAARPDDRHPRPAAGRGRSSRARSTTCRPTRPSARRSSRSSASPAWRPTTSTSPDRSCARSPSRSTSSRRSIDGGKHARWTRSRSPSR